MTSNSVPRLTAGVCVAGPEIESSDGDLAQLARLHEALGFYCVSAMLSIAAALIVVALTRGCSISLKLDSAVATAAVLALLIIVYFRSKRRSDLKLAAAVFSITVVFVSGALASITSCVGQMFEFPFIDSWLARVDAALGLSSDMVVGAIATFPRLVSLLRWAYMSSIPLVIVSGLLLAWLNREDRVYELCASFCFCVGTAAIISVILPAAGAFEYLGTATRYGSLLPPGAGVYHLETLHSLRASHQFVINPSHLEGLVTFPSFHTAMALMTAAAWRGYRMVGPSMMGWNGIVVLSTVPIGGHYLIDLVGGLASWLIVFRFGAPFAGMIVDRAIGAAPSLTCA